MQKIHCNIIKDLIPSYIDDLCSDESKELVEEHFKECNNCKKLYEQASLETIPAKPATARKEIDYFKTIQMNVNKKNTTLLIITGILFLLQLYVNFNSYRFSSNHLVTYINYLSPIFIALTLFPALPDFTEHSIPNKIKLPILGIEFGAMTYIFVLLIYTAFRLLGDKVPFGMQPENIGPFLVIQLYAIATCFIVAFVSTLIVSLRKKAICPALCFLPLGGLSLMFEYVHLLQKFTTNIRLTVFIQPYVILMAEVILLVGIYMIVNRKKAI